MATLQGNIVFPIVCSKEVGVHRTMVVGRLLNADARRGGYLASKVVHGPRIGTGTLSWESQARRLVTVSCTYSSSNGNESRAENFNDSDEDYVNSSVLEAEEIKSGLDGYTVKMRDGRLLKCVHNNPQAGHLPGFSPKPAIVLKMDDGSELLLPIIVLKMPSMLLMAALRNVQIARPTMYEVGREMIERMGYEVKLVRITRKVHDAYFAQLYLSKVSNKAESLSLDLLPSDAINIAVRCKVPVQVNRTLIISDGIKIVEAVKLPLHGTASVGLLSEWDRPSDQTSVETTEFRLLRNMIDAAREERYQDAARWRDELTRHRAKRNWA